MNNHTFFITGAGIRPTIQQSHGDRKNGFMQGSQYTGST